MSSSFRKPIVVRRRAGMFVDGRWVESENTLVPGVTASVQPASGKDLQRLPEGRRLDDVRKLFTDTELVALDEAMGRNPDVVEIGGKEFEVVLVGPWQNGVLSHYEVLVARRSAQAEEAA